MLTFRDLFHLPELDPLIGRMAAEKTGLIVIAGLDPRRHAGAGSHDDAFLPSGRHGLFGILLDQVLEMQPELKAVVVTRDEGLVRPPRHFKRRVAIDRVDQADELAARISAAARPDRMVVIDRLDEYTMQAARFAAGKQALVLAQLDTVFQGAEAARQIWLPDPPAGPMWILSVQRFAALCPVCKTRGPAGQTGTWSAPGCPDCSSSGRFGEVAAFDVYHVPAAGDGTPSARLPMKKYLEGLVRAGYLPEEEWLEFETGQLRRTYHLFKDREAAFLENQGTLESRLVQIESANNLLEQRTEALISLQTVGQALIESQDLAELAENLCRYAAQICDAQRAILYTQRLNKQVEVLAVVGWDPGLLKQTIDLPAILAARIGPEPQPFNFSPPGIPAMFEDFRIRSGLAVSLYAQNEWVGLMILHSSKKPRFLPSESALLQTFANQAALAIQRAGLVEQLRGKIVQLEAAQEELVRKERMEQEMLLARQVQQGLLPTVFPDLPGFRFAARCEPARQVGGDFYDVIELEDGCVGVAIGDVSDKGVPAALYMATTRSLLRVEARRDRSPAAVLTRVQRTLLEVGDRSNFVTMFYAVIDLQARSIRYARAGHDYPYLHRGQSLEQLGGVGMPLGLMEEPLFRLEEREVSLAGGFRLILYTDGITDVFDVGGKPFGSSRLEGLLRSCAAYDPLELTETIFASIAHFCGEAEPFDDRTLLIVEMD